jgi:hypothetical protein
MYRSDGTAPSRSQWSGPPPPLTAMPAGSTAATPLAPASQRWHRRYEATTTLAVALPAPPTQLRTLWRCPAGSAVRTVAPPAAPGQHWRCIRGSAIASVASGQRTRRCPSSHSVVWPPPTHPPPYRFPRRAFPTHPTHTDPKCPGAKDPEQNPRPAAGAPRARARPRAARSRARSRRALQAAVHSHTAVLAALDAALSHRQPQTALQL